MTYKEVSNYDIYSPSKDRKVLIDNIYVGLPIKRGNKKIEKNVGITSLMEGMTCLNCSSCYKTCYARKASCAYPSAYNFKLAYTSLATKNLNGYRDIVSMQIEKELSKGMEYLRIHEAGDFFSQDYIDMWNGIIKDFPSLYFYYYTKVEHLFNFRHLLSNPNVNRVNSILPNGNINFGSYEYILEMHEKYGYPICPFKKEDRNTYCGNCTVCMEHEHVLFLEH